MIDTANWDLANLGAALARPFHNLFSAGAPYGAPALLGALAVAGIYFVHRRRSQGREASLKDFFQMMFSQRLLWHPSTRLDMRLWIINGIILGSAYTWLAISALFCRAFAHAGLTSVLGAHAPLAWPTWSVLALATVAELLAYEFAYWFGHFLFHRYAWLWEFHKVHHSAEVMTTFTELRQHPIEIMAFVNLIALSTGTVFGVMTYVFGPGAHPFTLLNGNIALMLFLMSWGHLRPSHMWIAFRGVAGRLFQSPAHHQLHHSDNPLHWDKNLGFALAVWDWVFGTLVIPETRRQDITFGVGVDNDQYHTIADNFVTPFVKSWGHVAAWAKGPAPTAGQERAAH